MTKCGQILKQSSSTDPIPLRAWNDTDGQGFRDQNSYINTWSQHKIHVSPNQVTAEQPLRNSEHALNQNRLVQTYIIRMLLVSAPWDRLTFWVTKLQRCFERAMCCVHMKNNRFAITCIMTDRHNTVIKSLSVLSTCTIDMCLVNAGAADCRTAWQAADYSSQMH